MKKWIVLLAALMLCMAAAACHAEADVQAGDVVTFGVYEQDNDLNNGCEPLEWQVLAVEDGKALLLTQYAIDARPYQPGRHETVYPTWVKSSVRKWLYDEVFDVMFTPEQQDMLIEATLKNPRYKNNKGCDDTQDKIFLLSRDEVEQYMPDEQSRVVLPTPYCIARGAWVSKKYEVDGEPAVWWWLRTAGYYRISAASIRTVGTICSGHVYDKGGTIRPAVWVDLSKVEFQ